MEHPLYLALVTSQAFKANDLPSVRYCNKLLFMLVAIFMQRASTNNESFRTDVGLWRTKSCLACF